MAQAETSGMQHSWGKAQKLAAEHEKWRHFIAALQDETRRTGIRLPVFANEGHVCI